MASLAVSYLGLPLKNPVIVSSSGLTDSVEKIKKLESLGAGAVVLKSLFEEQINHEAGHLLSGSDYPEAADYIRNYTKSHSLEEYLTLIRSAKEAVSIPVIASINCISASEWIEFSGRIEEAGADALELNLFFLPADKNRQGSEYETVYFDLAERIRKVIAIPVAIKLGNQFSNILYLVNQLYNRGIEGVVLFNRFYSPDIDVQTLKSGTSEVFSAPSEIRSTLRWIGIVSGTVRNIDLAASTGVHDSDGVVKMILAGATAVQVCSTLYKNGTAYLPAILSGVEQWMVRQKFKTIGDFRGRMSYRNIPDPSVYERSQFMRYFSDHH